MKNPDVTKASRAWVVADYCVALLLEEAEAESEAKRRNTEKRSIHQQKLVRDDPLT